ncbi:MAG TPA: phosphate ABC transporter substrate-binding protein PstS, partial [Bacteroidia bacterium]
MRHSFLIKKLWNISLLALTVITLGSCGGGKKEGEKSATDDKTLLGAGSTFIYPLYSKMFSEYNKTTGLKVNY